jgi:hypothetical protein
MHLQSVRTCASPPTAATRTPDPLREGFLARCRYAKVAPTFVAIKLTLAAVSAGRKIRDEVRSFVHTEMDSEMRLTEMEYQPRARGDGAIERMMRHWNRSKGHNTVRSRDAVLIDLHRIWESKRSDVSTQQARLQPTSHV